MEEEYNEIEEKQNYLRKEIMNQNYNTDKFSDYISNLKENGVDLNNWTLEELKEVVTSFKNQENSEETNEEENLKREVENVKNSFILTQTESEPTLNLISSKNTDDNPYNKIFDDHIEFKNVENIMSDLNKEEGGQKKGLLDEFEIVESSQLIDTSTDKLLCIKQPENSLTKYSDLNVNIVG